jgi:hypothetical protein
MSIPITYPAEPLNVPLAEFVINNIVTRDNINSHYVIKIMSLLRKYNIPITMNLSYIHMNFADLIKLLEINPPEFLQKVYQEISYLEDINNEYSRISLTLNNPLQSLNSFISLRVLDFQYNRIIIDSDIKHLTQLKILRLPRNKIITCKGIQDMTQLEELDLTHNTNITNRALIRMTNLKKITIVHNKKISDNAFENMYLLEDINLGYNRNKNLNLTFLYHNPKIKSLTMFKKNTLSADIITHIRNNIKEVILPQLAYMT